MTWELVKQGYASLSEIQRDWSTWDYWVAAQHLEFARGIEANHSVDQIRSQKRG